MPNPGLVPRVEILEGKVEELAGLPDRMVALELQIVQFRAEVHAEFSATREELRQEFRQAIATLATKAELEQLRAEMREGDEETRRLMRVLHEEVLSRIALLGEGHPARPRSTGRRRKR